MADTSHRYWGSQEPQPLEAIVASVQDVQMAAGTRKTATMKIYGPIDSDGAPWGISAGDFSKAIAEVGDVDAINLHIHSPGGSAFDGVAIKNQLSQHPAKVHVTVDGLAASAASLIAMAGDTVTMAPSSQLMIHDASGLAYGQAADFQRMVAALDSLSNSYAAAYAAKAGGETATWRAAMTPETWFTAEEAVAAGLADSVAKPTPKTVADQPKTRFDLSIFAHAGRAAAPAPLIPSNAPAHPPASTPTPKEADAMSDNLIKGLRERLSMAEDATDEAVLAEFDRQTAEAKAALDAKPEPPKPAPKPEPVADGRVSIDADVLEELKIAARAGAEARAVQLREDRDATISAAITGGHIAPARKDAWVAKWEADPEGVRASIAELTASDPIYPVGTAPGVQGAAATTVHEYTDADAEFDARHLNLPKEALLNG